MEIYVFLIIVIGALSLLSALYIKYIMVIALKDYEANLVVITHNCAAICEGVLRDLINIIKRLGECQLIVLDKGSVDGTYEILKRLSDKYNFPLIQIKSHQEYKGIAEAYGLAKDSKVLVMDENTKYFAARIQIMP